MSISAMPRRSFHLECFLQDLDRSIATRSHVWWWRFTPNPIRRRLAARWWLAGARAELAALRDLADDHPDSSFGPDATALAMEITSGRGPHFAAVLLLRPTYVKFGHREPSISDLDFSDPSF